jgi:hypothetical protein
VLFGAPFDKATPNEKMFAGPAAGAGQSLAWSGKDTGKGTLTIEESTAPEKVRMKLAYVEPMASLATHALTLAPTPTGTLVTWSMDGNHNFIGKAFGVFADMDKMLGDDLDQTLAQLKAASEHRP